MPKPANDNYLRADVANLEAQINDLLTAYPELAEDAELRADMLDGETNLHAVLTRLIGIERDADSMVRAMADRISAMQTRKARHERRQEAMRGLVLKLMRAAGSRSVPLAEATVSIRSTPAKVEIIDEARLRKAYLRIVMSPDKTAIKEALEAGKKVAGAKMGEPGETLSVRVA